MKTLTINLLDDTRDEVVIYNKEKKQSILLPGKYTWEEYKALCSVIADDNIVVNKLGTGLSYEIKEMDNITTEELEHICEMLNQRLKERK